MSSAQETGKQIREKVEAEAQRAEAEEPETETPVEPEPEPGDDEDPDNLEPEPEPAPTGRKGKSPQERFEAAFTAFRKKAAEVFEVPVQEVVPAPHPGVIGIMLPGFAEPKTHPDFKGCETCNTLGKILTGANTGDPQKDWHVCPDERCKGRGFWQKSRTAPPAPTTGPLAVQPATADNGEFGEAPTWMGDPNLSPQV